MAACRRSAFSGVNQPPDTANRGLWLDCFLASMDSGGGDEGSAKTQHLERSRRIRTPDGYAEFEKARGEALAQLEHTRVLELTTLGRTIVGIGAATPWENSITLHRTWGVPIVPGTALKGVAAAYAHKRLEAGEWRRRTAGEQEGGGDWHNLLFGTTDERGLVCFHDALWQHDGSQAACGLHLDTITVHHPEYYQGKDVPPADWDSPTPIPFLSFSGKLISAITWCGGAADEATIGKWLDTAYEILAKALEEEGVGAKTSSGYGRMSIEQKLSEREKERRGLANQVSAFTFPKEPGDLSKLDQLVADLAGNEDFGTGLLRDLVGRAAALESKQRKMCRDRLLKLAASHKALEAALPEEWQREMAERSPAKVVARLEKQLAEHEDKKPGKKDKKIKRWKKEHDKLQKALAKARKEAESQTD